MEGIFMTKKELSRSELIQSIKNKRLSQRRAAEILGLSIRQIKRLYKNFKNEGPKGLISKKGGGKGNHCLSDELKKNILSIIIEKYNDFGPTLAHEKLTEIHRFDISLTSIRNIKKKYIHPLRPRRSRFGELVPPDDWFEERSPTFSLIIYVDDATGKILEGQFAETEITWNYYLYFF